MMENKKQREKNRALDSNSTPPDSTEEKGKETRELHQKYKKLEKDWNAFKESRSTTSRKYRSPLTLTTITNPVFQPLDISNNFKSPKELMSSLQRESWSSEEEEYEEQEEEQPRKDYPLAVKEILQERREAFERGTLKGRRLFDDDDNSDNGEVRSMSFGYPKDEDEDENELMGSSLSPLPIGDFVDKDMVTNAVDIKVGGYKSRFINGSRYGVFLGGFVGFVLLIVAMCMRLGISYGGGHDFDVFMVPT